MMFCDNAECYAKVVLQKYNLQNAVYKNSSNFRAQSFLSSREEDVGERQPGG